MRLLGALCRKREKRNCKEKKKLKKEKSHLLVFWMAVGFITAAGANILVRLGQD